MQFLDVVVMNLIEETRRNAPFVGVLIAILLAAVALAVIVAALLSGMG